MMSAVDDFEQLLSHMTDQEKIARFKRRWLMDLRLSRHQMDELSALEDKNIPESFLREDKAYHNSIKAVRGKVEEEVDLLLGFSSQLKQLVWDLVPGLEVDEEFANAYMGDSKESDDDKDRGDLFLTPTVSFDDSIKSSEGYDETIQPSHESHTCSGTVDGNVNVLSFENLLGSKVQSVNVTPSQDGTSSPFTPFCYSGAKKEETAYDSSVNVTPSQDGTSSPFTPICYSCANKEETAYDSSMNADPGNLQHEPHTNGSKYHDIEKACDAASKAMYDIIGGMIAELAQREQIALRPDELTYLESHN